MSGGNAYHNKMAPALSMLIQSRGHNCLKIYVYQYFTIAYITFADFASPTLAVTLAGSVLVFS